MSDRELMLSEDEAVVATTTMVMPTAIGGRFDLWWLLIYTAIAIFIWIGGIADLENGDEEQSIEKLWLPLLILVGGSFMFYRCHRKVKDSEFVLTNKRVFMKSTKPSFWTFVNSKNTYIFESEIEKIDSVSVEQDTLTIKDVLGVQESFAFVADAVEFHRNIISQMEKSSPGPETE